MAANEPLEISLKNVLDYFIVQNNEYRFVTKDFGIVSSFMRMTSELFFIHQPYKLKEGRIVYAVSGQVTLSINLIQYTAKKGDLLLLAPNSIIEVHEFTTDFEMRMMAIQNDFIQFLNKDEVLEYYIGRRENLFLPLSEKDYEMTERYFFLIWDTVHEEVFRKEVVQSLVSALLFNISYIRKRSKANTETRHTRQEETFHRFITLVHEYCTQERNVAFYADKLCLSPRYLNTLVKNTSRQTVMEWLNQAVVIESKVLLKHSDLLVYQIADKLNFPNPSFFCKFFKKMTGMTPMEYQKS